MDPSVVGQLDDVVCHNDYLKNKSDNRDVLNVWPDMARIVFSSSAGDQWIDMQIGSVSVTGPSDLVGSSKTEALVPYDVSETDPASAQDGLLDFTLNGTFHLVMKVNDGEWVVAGRQDGEGQATLC